MAGPGEASVERYFRIFVDNGCFVGDIPLFKLNCLRVIQPVL